MQTLTITRPRPRSRHPRLDTLGNHKENPVNTFNFAHMAAKATASVKQRKLLTLETQQAAIRKAPRMTPVLVAAKAPELECISMADFLRSVQTPALDATEVTSTTPSGRCTSWQPKAVWG